MLARRLSSGHRKRGVLDREARQSFGRAVVDEVYENHNRLIRCSSAELSSPVIISSDMYPVEKDECQCPGSEDGPEYESLKKRTNANPLERILV
jgi:hypothetical protein